MSGSGRTNHDIMQLIRYSDSLDSKVSENSREALKSLIDQGFFSHFFFLVSLVFIDVYQIDRFVRIN